MHRDAERPRGQIDAGHFDRGFGVEQPRHRGVEACIQPMDVRGIDAVDAWSEPLAQRRERRFDGLGGVARGGIDVAQSHRSARSGDPDQRALLHCLGEVGVLEPWTDERHRDAEHLDALDGERRQDFSRGLPRGLSAHP